MKWIFAASGGSGSTFLIDSLINNGFTTHKRPKKIYNERLDKFVEMIRKA